MLTGAAAHAAHAARGGGVPAGVWLLLVALAALLHCYCAPAPMSLSVKAVYLACGAALGWLAPLRTIGQVAESLGALRENLRHVAPHLPALLPYALDVVPHLPKLVRSIDKMGPLMEALMKEKQYVLPILPEVLAKIDLILPELDVLGPNMHLIAPHASQLIPHIELLVPHVRQMAPHLPHLVIFLRVRGWEEALPYLDKIVPHVDHIAPHAERLAPHLDPLLPHLPILVKYIDNLAPQMEATVDVLDRLTPLIPLLPIADQTGVLYSKLVCRALPRVARILPSSDARRSFDALPPASPLPRDVAEATELTFQVPSVDVSGRHVRYCIVLNKRHVKSLRYSELRATHDAMQLEASSFCKRRLLPFPSKTYFWKGLGAAGLERRRIAIENYLECTALVSEALIEESPAFRALLRAFLR